MKINPTAAYYAYNKISEHLRPVHAEEAAAPWFGAAIPIRSRSALKRRTIRKWSSMPALLQLSCAALLPSSVWTNSVQRSRRANTISPLKNWQTA